MRSHFLILEKKDEEYILKPVEKIIRVDKLYKNESKISMMREMNKNSSEKNCYVNLKIN